jgi:hypothetical protein
LQARSALLASLLLLSAGSADAQQAPKNCPALDLRYDEAENVSEKRSDKNKDCRPDEIVYYAEGRPERAESDTDLDGRMDVWTFFEADGKTFGRQEQDTNKNGKADRWIQYRGGKPATQLDDRNGDARPDSTLFYEGDHPAALEEDTNLDGENDRWVTYRAGKTAVVEQDRDFDGDKDLRAELEPDGSKRLEQQDTKSDGKYDVWIHFEKGEKVRVEEDTNADAKVDVVTHTRGEEILRRGRRDSRLRSWPSSRRARSAGRRATRTATARRSS